LALFLSLVCESVGADDPSAEDEKPAGFAGFWKIPDTRNSWIKLGGFVKLDAMYDSDAIGSQDDFVPSTIPVGDGSDVNGASGRTNFSYRPTRLWVDARKKIDDDMIRGYVSVDLFGGTSENPALRIRHAYFQLQGLVWNGDLTLGQAWSYFVDEDAFPESLDFEVASGSILLRQPLIGWKRHRAGTEFLVSLEEPASDVTGADGLTRFPDVVAGGRWNWGSSHIKIAALGRELRASLNDGPVATTLAGGVTMSGRLGIGTRGDNFRFQLNGGEGIGRYIDDSVIDAVFDPVTGELEAIPKVSGVASYQHWWNRKLRTNAVYSSVYVDNLDIQASTALRRTHYAMIDLIWSPYESVDLGIEALFGERENKDRQSGTANRIQISGKYSF
jgi:hypothetical protein